jgi:hypothetical protein
VTDNAPTAPVPASPVPTSQVVMEIARSTVIVGLLVLTTVAFAFVGAWIVAIILGLITLGGLFSGAVVHPAQLRAALRPQDVVRVDATAITRRKQAWLMVRNADGQELVMELRSKRLARHLGGGTVPVTVAGKVEAGGWVVAQALRYTIWPASKLQVGTPAGASPEQGEGRTWGDRMR